jgi:hypothetical protein
MRTLRGEAVRVRGRRVVWDVVLALLVALGGCVSTSPSRVVAWYPFPTTTTTLPPAPFCNAKQLKGSAGNSGFGLGNRLTTIELTNVGTTCRLEGYPRLLGISPRGTTPLTADDQGTYFGNTVPANLPTAAKGELLLGTDVNCSALNQPDQAAMIANAATHTYTGVVIILPGGQGSVVVSGLEFDTACFLDETQLGVPAPVPTYPPPRGSFEALVARIRVVHSVRWGTTLRYQLVLHNPFKAAVSILPCPNYEEVLYPTKGKGMLAARSYGLHCDGIRALAPRATVSFAMELHVPKAKMATSGELLWYVNNTDGEPTAHATIRLVR